MSAQTFPTCCNCATPLTPDSRVLVRRTIRGVDGYVEPAAGSPINRTTYRLWFCEGCGHPEVFENERN